MNGGMKKKKIKIKFNKKQNINDENDDNNNVHHPSPYQSTLLTAPYTVAASGE